MTTTYATDAPTFEALATWQQLPDGMTVHETPGVAVDADDQVYALTRNPDNPVIVFSPQGEFRFTFGKGIFSDRTHGISVGPDGNIYCVDDGTHTVTKFTPKGELLMTIGTPNKPTPRWSGEPFCRPTQAAISKSTGDIFISDGYLNNNVHKYTADGRHVLTWGGPGLDPGQFMLPHNIAIDDEERIYVADREAHRVQIFDTDGKFIAMWNNINRPCGLTVGPDGNIYIGELDACEQMKDCPGYGHRVSVYTPEGKLLSRFGDPEEGQTPGKFVAPHGIAVDSHGDVYVGEVTFTNLSRQMKLTSDPRSLSKLRRLP